MSGCSNFRTSKGSREECLTCGRVRSEHQPESTKKELEVKPDPRIYFAGRLIKIYFAGKLYEYANWEEARKDGFYLG